MFSLIVRRDCNIQGKSAHRHQHCEPLQPPQKEARRHVGLPNSFDRATYTPHWIQKKACSCADFECVSTADVMSGEFFRLLTMSRVYSCFCIDYLG